jgi:hypothetical protein
LLAVFAFTRAGFIRSFMFLCRTTGVCRRGALEMRDLYADRRAQIAQPDVFKLFSPFGFLKFYYFVHNNERKQNG